MLDLIFLKPILIYIFTNQILASVMGKYSKEFKGQMKNRSNYLFKSFLVVLFIISIVQMSESNGEDVTESTNLIQTENLQSPDDKTEESVGKVASQIVYFQGTEKSTILQAPMEDISSASLLKFDSNNLLSFIPNLKADDDDSEQNDAQELSYLLGESGSTKVSTRALQEDDEQPSIVKLLGGNRMLLKKDQLQSNDEKKFRDVKKFLVSDPSKNRKLYLVDHLSEIERIRGYLPSLMKLKRLVKKCQCSFQDEDQQYLSIKDVNHVDHRINLDYMDSDEESDDDEKDDDDEQQYKVQGQKNFNKYKKIDLNNFRGDEETENEDLEKIIRFNEIKEGEEKNREDNLEEFEDSLDVSSSEESIEEDEFEEINETLSKEEDRLNSNINNNSLNNQEKLLSPFMTNLSPTSSSDLIFNNFNNELDEQLENEINNNNSKNNEIQLARLKKIIEDELAGTNETDSLFKTVNDDANSLRETNVLDENDSLSENSFLSTHFSNLARGGSGGGNNRGDKGGKGKNLFDHLFLNRKRRQANKPTKL